MPIAAYALIACFALLLISNVDATDLNQYPGYFGTSADHWYPGWQKDGPALIRGSCSEFYELYTTRSIDLYYQIYPNSTSFGSQSKWIHGLVSCLLEHTDELTKAEGTVSSVILGLLPTILLYASASYIELGLLAQCRPILTILLALASPGLDPRAILRRNDYQADAQLILIQPKATSELAGITTSRIQPSRAGVFSILISLVEYALVLAAIANVVHNTWQLSVFTVCAYAPQTAFQPLLWVLFALCIHCLEITCTALRVVKERSKPPELNTGGKPRGVGHYLLSTVSRMVEKEFNICAVHETVTFHFRRPTLPSQFLFFICNILTILFISWGTFFFSSILFVKVMDAIVIFCRYLASVLVARLVLQYELDGMSTSTKIMKS